MINAYINNTLFRIKVVEEWCGPILWTDSCRKSGEVCYHDDSDSGDSLGEGPPLGEAWGNNVEEDWDDEGLQEEDEGDGDTVYEEVSMVPETDGSSDERQVVRSGSKPVDEGVHNLKQGSGDVEVTHISNSVGCEGSHVDSSVGVQSEGGSGCAANSLSSPLVQVGYDTTLVEIVGDIPIEAKDALIDSGGAAPRKSGGGDVLQGVVEAPILSRSGGPTGSSSDRLHMLKLKGNEVQSPEKKGSQLSIHHEVSGGSSQHSSQSKNDGVVRNPIDKFQPSSSMSLDDGGTGFGSHVESIGDSGILMGNSRYEKTLERSNAEKLWGMATNFLGVTAEEDEEELFIERLRAMEERDKAVKGKKGKPKRSK